MGYGGKLAEQQRARELRAQAWTVPDIARELGVSKSSVSLWVRDVEFTPRPRHSHWTRDNPHPMHIAKQAEIARCDAEAMELIGRLSDREFLVAGAMLYLGEGFKRDGLVGLANTDQTVLAMFVTWLRRYFDVDETRLRLRLYLHEGLDIDTARTHWSQLLSIPLSQFTKPFRAVADPTIRRSKHVLGCPAITYADSLTHRRGIGLIRAVTSTFAIPG